MRLDKKAFALLHMLKPGICLDSLMNEEEPMPPYLEDIKNDKGLIFDMTTEQRIQFASDKGGIKYARRVSEYYEFIAKIRQTMNSSGIFWQLKDQSAYDSMPEEYQDLIEKTLTTIRPPAYFVCNDTFQAIVKSGQLMLSKLNDLIVDLSPSYGIISFIGDDKSKRVDYLIYAYEGSKLVCCRIMPLSDRPFVHIPVSLSHIDLTDCQSFHDDSKKMSVLALMVLMFLRFFDHETLTFLPPTAHAKGVLSGKLNEKNYDSQVSYPITIVDAKWYRSIVRDDPFLVKGHFRKQPFGPSRTQYRMQWISGFQKSGYHRKAKGVLV